MTNEAVSQSTPFHVFARLLNGGTKTLLFDTPRVCARAVKERIFDFTRIPIAQQRLIYGGHQIEDSFVIPFPDSTVHLCLRLRGGKGGFGSLLRGAANKAGQKKTNNFDACRDMSGRRLRHVNAEKKLEEWQAEAEDRRLEKIAEEFIKKASKKGKRGVGDGEAEKYVEKYRKDSAACVARVELSVREAVGSSGALKKSVKRKLSSDAGVDGKKLKIWMGKRKMAGSDDDMDEDSSDDDEENDKSAVLDKSNSSDSAKDGELSSDSITRGRQDEKNTAFGSSGSGSEEEKETIVQDNSDSDGCIAEESISNKDNGKVEPVIDANNIDHVSCFPSPKEVATADNDAIQVEDEQQNNSQPGKSNEETSQVASSPDNEGSFKVVEVSSEVNADSENKAKPAEEIVSVTAEKGGEQKPLNLDEFGSASELEVLGLERLKVELQSRGLKCGGTLQERAARLFLLKSTPLDKIPKKLLAKK